jgi:hypothetical protein
MINGAHAIIYSRDAEADRAFLREVLKFPSVDAGGGWLIFALPPAEIAVHPAGDDGGRQELYLMCEDIGALVAELGARDVSCAPVTDQRWGLLTEVTLPSGARLGVYEPRHARPAPPAARRSAPSTPKPKAARRRPAARPKAGNKNRKAANKKAAKKKRR